ncbi:hypothetical protein HYS49_01005 [Candidatus Woesearchaeota archaeon]|nr:hypothetical protein [Candidatus Woesearchaeota archaeon]
MATIIDLGLLQLFDFIFPVLITFALVYALLQKTAIIGKSPGINATISIAAGLMILLSRTLVEVINFMVPWFVVALVFFTLLLLIFQMFGVKDASFEKAVKDPKLLYTIIGVGVIILLASFGHVLGQAFTEQSFQPGVAQINATTGVATPSFEVNIWSTLFHPKILGFIVLFAIAVFTVALLTGAND